MTGYMIPMTIQVGWRIVRTSDRRKINQVSRIVRIAEVLSCETSRVVEVGGAVALAVMPPPRAGSAQSGEGRHRRDWVDGARSRRPPARRRRGPGAGVGSRSLRGRRR